MVKIFLKEIDGINLIDIGSSGNLDSKWKPIEKFIHLIGFDPNAEECIRMSNLPHNFRSVKYLPYAVAGNAGIQTLFKTKSIYCFSLLEPNTTWLRRFSFSDLFERTGEEKIDTVVLSQLEEIERIDIDVIKTDTQGLELPILSHAGSALEKAFFVETETGFVENYIGETTYAQIDEFMRSKGFLLFDMNISHRIPRNNVFKNSPTGAEQLMWCEATWLKDYVSLINKGLMSENDLSRAKVLKIIVLCALQGCFDYGYELANLFAQYGFIEKDELEKLQLRENWQIEVVIPGISPNEKAGFLSYALRLFPKKIRAKIKEQADLAAAHNHLFH